MGANPVGLRAIRSDVAAAASLSFSTSHLMANSKYLPGAQTQIAAFLPTTSTPKAILGSATPNCRNDAMPTEQALAPRSCALLPLKDPASNRDMPISSRVGRGQEQAVRHNPPHPPSAFVLDGPASDAEETLAIRLSPSPDIHTEGSDDVSGHALQAPLVWLPDISPQLPEATNSGRDTPSRTCSPCHVGFRRRSGRHSLHDRRAKRKLQSNSTGAALVLVGPHNIAIDVALDPCTRTRGCRKERAPAYASRATIIVSSTHACQHRNHLLTYCSSRGMSTSLDACNMSTPYHSQ